MAGVVDYFKHSVHKIDSIPSNAEAIVPHATNPLPHTARRIHIGGAGDLVVKMKGGNTVTFVGLAAGTEKNGAFTHVLDTSTCTLMIAEW